MCDSSKGFKLCTCIGGSQQDDKDNKYKWRLLRYEGPSMKVIMGKFHFPVSDLGNGLTSQVVVKGLNARNAFDFDYSPSDGDCVLIRLVPEESRPRYMAFIYRGGEWVEDFYDPLTNELSFIKDGDVLSS
jgi:hypothetical protein